MGKCKEVKNISQDKDRIISELVDALQDALQAYDKHNEDPCWDYAREVISKALGENNA